MTAGFRNPTEVNPTEFIPPGLPQKVLQNGQDLILCLGESCASVVAYRTLTV